MITSNYKHSTKNRTSLYKLSYSNFALFIAFRFVHCLLQFYKEQIPCFIFSPWQMHLTVPARLRAWIDAMIVERFPQITIVADITDFLLHQPCVDQVRNLCRFQHSRQAHKLQGICLVAHEAEQNLANPVFVLRRSLRHILQDILPIHLDAHVLIEMSLNLVYMVYLLTDVAIKVVLNRRSFPIVAILIFHIVYLFLNCSKIV